MVTVKEFFLGTSLPFFCLMRNVIALQHAEIFCVPSLNPKNSLFLTCGIYYFSNQADFFNG
jgi:hypothetical protein